MYITRTKKIVGTKVYRSILLVRSVRKNGVPRHETILNLTKWNDKHIAILERALKGQESDTKTPTQSNPEIPNLESIEVSTGKSIGGILTIAHLAKKCGIETALGTTKQAKLAMALIAGRLLTQGSRLKLCEWQEMNELDAVMGVPKYTENDLYHTLDWLAKNQAKIESRLFQYRYTTTQKKPVLFLYDITSSYMEGQENELAKYGYNRDGKKGKKQIVIGLLTDQEGAPVSVEVFEGNRSDSTTVIDQIEKMATRFGVTELVLVGDKGMIKRTQIKAFKEHTHYITSITRSQIQSLIKEGVFQPSLFDNELTEISHEGSRYILRKNPLREKEIQEARQERLDFMKAQTALANTYLKDHSKAKVETQLIRLNNQLKKLSLASFCEINKDGEQTDERTDERNDGRNDGRTLCLAVDESKRTELAQLDGCYVLKTDVAKETLSTQQVHDRYKDLAKVESAFRAIKTGCLEVRPVYVRKDSRTRGHVFVTMLAYMIAQSFSLAIKPLNLATGLAWDYVDQLQTTTLSFKELSVKKIGTPTSKCAAIFDAIGMKVPNLSFVPD